MYDMRYHIGASAGEIKTADRTHPEGATAVDRL